MADLGEILGSLHRAFIAITDGVQTIKLVHAKIIELGQDDDGSPLVIAEAKTGEHITVKFSAEGVPSIGGEPLTCAQQRELLTQLQASPQYNMLAERLALELGEPFKDLRNVVERRPHGGAREFTALASNGQRYRFLLKAGQLSEITPGASWQSKGLRALNVEQSRVVLEQLLPELKEAASRSRTQLSQSR